MWKGSFHKIGLEYRDTDSEDEGSGHKRQTSAIQILDYEENHRHDSDNENFMDCGKIAHCYCHAKLQTFALQ